VVEAERRLWRAVLDQAYEDAETRAPGDVTASESSECTRARRYLRADVPAQAGLLLVCDFADIPADRVISWARHRYPLAA
jgi:hypothetical protein